MTSEIGIWLGQAISWDGDLQLNEQYGNFLHSH